LPEEIGLGGLFGRSDLARDIHELVVDRGAESAGASDDRNSDQSGDQAVFNGSCARLIFYKTRYKLGHLGTPIPFFYSKPANFICCVDRICPNYPAAIAIRLTNMINENLPLESAAYGKSAVSAGDSICLFLGWDRCGGCLACRQANLGGVK
jgi:hypothetical protein